jgi:protein SCO1/2
VLRNIGESRLIPVLFLAFLASDLNAERTNSCGENLHELSSIEQLECVQSNRLANASNEILAGLLTTSDALTDHRVIAGILEEIRGRHDADDELVEAIVGLLAHQNPVYQNRDRWHVVRLRAYVFATLADIGFPESALPMLVDAIAFVDERMAAVEIGSAIRVAGTLGEGGHQFLPYMLPALGERFAEEEFSLSRYALDFPSEEATTVQLEIIAAVEKIGTAADKELLTVLRAVADSPSHSGLDARFVAASRRALPIVEQRIAGHAHHDHQKVQPDEQSAPSMVSAWVSPDERRLLQDLDVRIVDQDGKERVLSDLLDRPVLLTFFYTRCQNAGKCSMSVSRLAFLQKELRRVGLARDVRLLALTFEPAYDTPERLRRFVQDRGLLLDEFAFSGRLGESHHDSFIKELDIPVSFSAGWVNTHGVEAVLIDTEGRLARKYAATAWDTDQITDDFLTLMAER